MKNKITEEQKAINAVWILKLINSFVDEGTWIWPQRGTHYLIRGGKVHPKTKNGEKWLNQILPEGFAKRMVVPLKLTIMQKIRRFFTWTPHDHGMCAKQRAGYQCKGTLGECN